MLANDKIKSYSYNRKESARITTQSGDYDAVLYESTRTGSSRLSRIWHAPALGYIPVRALPLLGLERLGLTFIDIGIRLSQDLPGGQGGY